MLSVRSACRSNARSYACTVANAVCICKHGHTPVGTVPPTQVASLRADLARAAEDVGVARGECEGLREQLQRTSDYDVILQQATHLRRELLATKDAVASKSSDIDDLSTTTREQGILVGAVGMFVGDEFCSKDHWPLMAIVKWSLEHRLSPTSAFERSSGSHVGMRTTLSTHVDDAPLTSASRVARRRSRRCGGSLRCHRPSSSSSARRTSAQSNSTRQRWSSCVSHKARWMTCVYSANPTKSRCRGK